MNIFHSHKGRIFQKAFISLIVLAFVSMVWSNSQEPVEKTDESSAVVEAKPQLGPARVYYDPSLDDEAAPESTTEPTPDETDSENSQKLILSAAEQPVSPFMEAWTTYDYSKPPSAGSLPSYPKDAKNQKNMKPVYDAWIKNMKDKKELSNGQVTEVRLQSIDYSGSPDSGFGKATYIVTVSQTITNKDVGDAGTNVVEDYTVVTERLNDTSTEDRDEWFVRSIKKS